MKPTLRNVIPFTAAAIASAALVAACDRPSAQVIPPGAERLSRTAAESPVANELPRDVEAAARQPSRPAVPSREAISDTVITTKVKAALATDPGMAGADVSVNTEHGVVILAGTVKSYEQTGIASAHAQKQDGVMRVDNQLSLMPQ